MTVDVDVRPATLAEILETIAENFDLRAHVIAENYDDIDDWETKMALANSRAGAIRLAVKEVRALERVTKAAAACGGQEQPAFETWASGYGYDMHEHPLHYLFVNDKTNAARMGWNAALAYVRANLTADQGVPKQTDCTGSGK